MCPDISYKNEIENELIESAELKKSLVAMSEEIFHLSREIIQAFGRGNKLLICGNGGSAADSQHIAAEIIGRFQLSRKALPAIALTTDTSVLTALGNDFGYNTIFTRQIEALGDAGDVLLLISTSGDSPNLCEAAKYAVAKKLLTIALLGKRGGELANIVDTAFVVPSELVPRIQEAHITIGHILCSLIEKQIKEPH